MVLILHRLSPGILSVTTDFYKRNCTENTSCCHVKNKICFWKKNLAFLRTWPVFKKCLDRCHVFQNAKFCIQRQILFFTWDMSMHKNLFKLKINQFCILSFHFSYVNSTEKHFSMQVINDYPPWPDRVCEWPFYF